MKWLLFIVGYLALLLGFIGIFLPILPTTPFILLAAWCFLKSSPRMHKYLYQSRVFGPPLRDWEERRAISKKSKIIALSTIAVSGVILWFKVPNPPLVISISVLLFTVSIFIYTRPQ